MITSGETMQLAHAHPIQFTLETAQKASVFQLVALSTPRDASTSNFQFLRLLTLCMPVVAHRVVWQQHVSALGPAPQG
jgi:hypothetical protein